MEAVFSRLELDPYKYLRIDERYFRPKDIDILLGDSSKAKEQMGWKPGVKFKELVEIMTDHDFEAIKDGAQLI